MTDAKTPRILVPLELTETSTTALKAARQLLRKRRDLRVLLLHVRQEGDSFMKAACFLGNLCDELGAEGIDAAYHVHTGDPAEEILTFAGEAGVELIAMSSHGRNGLRRAFLGSVTEQVLRFGKVPLLVTRAETRFPEWTQIVAAVDGSPAAESVLPDVAAIARLFGATVDLVLVADPLTFASEYGVVSIPQPYGNPEPYLAGLSRKLETEGVLARPVLLEGHAVPELVAYAEKTQAGLLCLTTQGRTGLARLWLGSTAEALLRRAPCPIFVRRATQIPAFAAAL